MNYVFFVTTITPTRIRTPPAKVSGFVTTTTPARIRTIPAPVSGIVTTTTPTRVSGFEQHSLTNNILLKKIYLNAKKIKF